MRGGGSRATEPIAWDSTLAQNGKTGTAAGGAALVVSLISLSLLGSPGNNVARFLLESQGLAVFDLPRERVAHSADRRHDEGARADIVGFLHELPPRFRQLGQLEGSRELRVA